MNLNQIKNILILPPENIQRDNLIKVLALFYTLKKLGKDVNLFLKKIPEDFRFLNSIVSPVLKKLIISINSKGKEISELHYEKNENKLKLYLTMKEGEIQRKDIFFHKQPEQPELIIVFGEENLENPGFYFEKNPGFFLKSPILVTTLNRAEEICQKILNSTNPLLRRNNKNQCFNISQIKILSKIFEKLDYNKEKQLPIIFLEQKDFREAGFCSGDLKFIISELIKFWQLTSFLFLWESQGFLNTKKALFYSSKEPNIAKKILENFKGVSKGKGVIFLIEEDSWEKAKEKVLQIL